MTISIAVLFGPNQIPLDGVLDELIDDSFFFFGVFPGGFLFELIQICGEKVERFEHRI